MFKLFGKKKKDKEKTESKLNNSRHNEKINVEKIPTHDKLEIKQFLIVDDSEINRDVLTTYITRLGYSTLQAVNGKEAIYVICGKHVDFVFVDIQMPVMDGITMTAQLRERGFDKIIVGITGHVDQDSIKKCKTAGMNHVMAKPVCKQDLKFIIEKFMDTNQ